MTRETKVGLLVGMGVILLIGIIVSDHLSMAQKQTPPDMTDYGSIAQSSLNAQGTGMQTIPVTQAPVAAAAPQQPLPTPSQFDAQRDAQHNAPYDTRVQVASQQQPNGYPAPATDIAITGQMPAPVARSAEPVSNELAAAMDAHINQPAVRINPDFETAALASSVNVAQRPTQGPQPSIHYVQSGETLYAIANRYYNNGELWHIIRQANPNLVRSDNTVNLGARLLIPNKALLPELLRQNPQAATLLSQVTNDPATAIPSTPRSVIVKPGDTLSGLASQYLGTSRRWQELLDANKDKMDTPQDLRVGMTINLPGTSSVATTSSAAATSSTASSAASSSPAASNTPAVVAAQSNAPSNMVYTVQPGDTLSRIAESKLGNGSLWNSIYQANRDQLKNANDLAPGMKIKIPVQR